MTGRRQFGARCHSAACAPAVQSLTVRQHNVVVVAARHLHHVYRAQRLHQLRLGLLGVGRAGVAQLMERVRAPREQIAPFVDRDRVRLAAGHLNDHMIPQTIHQN